MKLSDKFGLNAVIAVMLCKEGLTSSPNEAWNRAGKIVLENSVYIEKPCPKSAFLGLCEEGLVKGIPSGDYTNSEKNKEYAIRGFEYLKEHPDIRNDVKMFWEIIGPKPKISHNYQLNVVIKLWEYGMLNK